jgi:hypothetical protein
MRRKSKTFAFVFALMVLSGYTTASRGEDGREPSHFTYARLYCTPDGNTHFQDVTVELRKTDFAPPAPPVHIGNDFAASRAFLGGSTQAGALRTSKTVSTTLLPQLNSVSSCKVRFPSPRPTARPGDSVPAACFDWKTPRPARGTSLS